MDTLLVVDGDVWKEELLRKIDSLSSGGSVVAVLNFSAVSLSPGLNEHIILVPIAPLLERVLPEARKQFRENLKAAASVSDEIFAAKISELNFADEDFQICLRNLVCATALSELRPASVQYIGNSQSTFRFLRQRSGSMAWPSLFTRAAIAFRGLRKFFSFLLAFFSNIWGYLLYPVISRIQERDEVSFSYKETLLVAAPYRRSWTESSAAQLVFRFFDEDWIRREKCLVFVTAHLLRNSRRNTGLFSALRTSALLASKKSTIDPFANLTFADVFASVMRRSELSRTVFSELLRHEKISYSSLTDWLNFRFLDLPKSRLVEIAYSRALARFPGKSPFLVFGFEFVEGRAIIAAAKARELFVAGVQHGAAGPLHYLRLVDPVAEGISKQLISVPDSVIVQGEEIMREYRVAGYPHVWLPESVGYSPNPQERTSRTRGANSNRVLVISEMHNWKPLWLRTVELAKTDPNRNFTFRAHPSRQLEARKAWGRLPRDSFQNLDLSEMASIQEEIDNEIDFVVSDSTGAAVEIGRRGIPIFAFLPSNVFGLGPFWAALGLGPTLDETSHSFARILDFLSSSKMDNYCASLIAAADRISMQVHPKELLRVVHHARTDWITRSPNGS